MNRLLSNPIDSLQSSFRVTFEKIVEYPKTALAVTGIIAGSAYHYFYNYNRLNTVIGDEKRPKRGFSGIEQLYFDISLDLDTAPQNRQEIFQQKLTQLLSTGEYLLSESKIDLAIKYFSTASGLAVIMSDWEKANELMENLINIYSPKLTQDEVHMLKSNMLSEMKLGEGLRQREQEQNEAEIDEITPSVLKQIENMPKKANFNSKCFL